MSSFKNWLDAFRLRTLPLSLSGIIFGSSIAKNNGYWDKNVFIFSMLTTILFQILSNLANDYGDGLKGTDNNNRIGPARTIQSGKISAKSMLFAIVFTSFFSLISALILIYFGSKNLSKDGVYFYIFLALACIIAAITYTVGKKAYGYSGFGDLFVFLFFGLVSVLGVYTLYSKNFEWFNVFPAISIGLLSTAVLNLNNMRDNKNDLLSNKNTFVVKIGIQKAKYYHFCLIGFSFFSFIFYFIYLDQILYIISLIPYVLLIKHLIFVFKVTNEKDFDPELKKVALSTFLISLIFLFLVLFNHA